MESRRVPLHRGVRRQDDLADALAPGSRHQGVDRQMLRLDTLDRRDVPHEDVVNAADQPRPLQQHEILGLFDDDDETVVAARVAADAARIIVGQVIALGAVPQLPLDVLNGLGEGQGLIGRAAQEVEGDPLGAPRPDAGQFGQLDHQPFEWFSYGTRHVAQDWDSAILCRFRSDSYVSAADPSFSPLGKGG